MVAIDFIIRVSVDFIPMAMASAMLAIDFAAAAAAIANLVAAVEAYLGAFRVQLFPS